MLATSDTFKDMNEPPVPQADLPEEPKKVLRLARQIKEQSQSVIKLARNRWFVNEDANLLDLADDLATWTGIQAVGVVSEQGKVVGIVVRRDIFDLLGRPFGRDVLRRETVAKVALTPTVFHVDANIFSVSEEIGQAQDATEIRYFPLRTGSGEFAGIFSSQDLLVYLSDITQKDIVLAASIQNRIVKEFVHQDQEHFEMVSTSVPAKGVGGDFHHASQYDEDSWFSCVCDVSGKGMAASLVTTALWGVIQSYDFRRGLLPLLKQLNRFMITTFQLERFVTGVFMDFHPRKGELIVSDCGHGYGFLFRDGKLLHMKSGDKNYPLGVSNEAVPRLYHYKLHPGDIIVLLTDGILEQGNESGEEYGLKRVKNILTRYHSSGLKSLRVRLLEDFHGFRGSSPLHDDMTFQFILYKG